MSRRTLLWLLGVAALLVGGVLLAIDGRMWDEGGPGIVGFELAFDEESADRILAEWGGDGRDAARLSLWLDFLYMALYGAFWTLAAAAVRDLARGRAWSRFAAAGSVAVAAAVVAPLADALENVCLLLVLEGTGGGTTPLLAGLFASVKFLCLTVAILYVVIGLLRAAFARFPRGARVVAGVVVLLVAGLLAVNTWSLDRETKAAEPGAGRLLDVQGTQVNVREDGSAVDPVLVLIHGFTASTHWWTPVTPALARRFRVIRVDLLGHGSSESPRDGYSMEHQADLVAGALELLDVKRATVVGHSMGGLVATALAERHGELVDRLVTIGTPPDTEHTSGAASERLSGVPVIGHAGWRLVPERMVRARLEESFAPELDVPAALVDDTAGMTYSAYAKSADESSGYRRERTVPDRLREIGKPTLVVYGTEDTRVQPSSAELFRGLPRTQVVVLDGIGHNAQFEAPARTAVLIAGFARPAR